MGLGLVLGTPTALSAKYWLANNAAVDFGIGLDFADATIFGDYLLEFPGVFAGRSTISRELAPYIGFGLLFHSHGSTYHRYTPYEDRHYHSTYLNLRVPLGIEWLTPKVPLGVFLEIVPSLYLVPGIGLEIMGGIGIRYYF